MRSKLHIGISLIIGISCTLPLSAMVEQVIIPKPLSLEKLSGEFEFSKETELLYQKENKDAQKIAKFVANSLKTPFGYKLSVESFNGESFFSRRSGDTVLFTAEKNDKSLNSEGYSLEVATDKITIRAKEYAGFFYGYMTLRQMLPIQIESKKMVKKVVWKVSACKIKDQPRLSWRGMHLDESRHFFGVEAVKQFIDFCSMHKMNRFHWHIVDDGGWRIEIKKYPRLTSVGAWRNKETFKWSNSGMTWPRATNPDSKDVYGGFYTQEQVREIVKYAAMRNIEVIPEIEMPGHVMPVLAAYPEFGSHPAGGFYSVDRLPEGMDLATFRKRGWGYSHQNVVDVGKPEVTKFFKNVLDEVFELFPSKWIHIGGDEVQKHYWENSPWIADLMKKEGLKDQHEVQSHFLKEMGKYLTANGRSMVGWDEIVDGGLAPNATVMYWISGGRMQKALDSGHDVVMSPMGPCYFDFTYDSNSVESVYNWKVMPDNIKKEQEKLILGAQANVWTEWMNDWNKVQYMIMPRMISLAENLWTPVNDKNLDNFLGRMSSYYQRLDYMKVNYYIPAPIPVNQAIIFATGEKDKVEFVVSKNPNFSIIYTIDGSEPTTSNSTFYSKPIRVDKSLTVKAATITTKGQISKVTTVNCVRFSLPEVTNLEPGLSASFAKGNWSRIPDFKSIKIESIAKVENCDISAGKGKDNFAMLFSGFIKIPVTGSYKFATGSDDGSYLNIAGAKVVDNDGLHGYAIKGGRVSLKAGMYPIEVAFLEGGGNETLDVMITVPGEKQAKLSCALLYRTKVCTTPKDAIITTSMKPWENNSANCCIDGNDQTLFWTNHGVNDKDYFTVEFSKEEILKSIKVVTGKSDGTDQLLFGILEASTDGTTYKSIAEFKNGVATAYVKEGTKFIRIKPTKDSGNWIAIQSITID